MLTLCNYLKLSDGKKALITVDIKLYVLIRLKLAILISLYFILSCPQIYYPLYMS